MDMRHRTSTSHLRAKMGRFMRAVRGGAEVVLTDRDEPVARLVSYREAAPASPDEPAILRPRDPAAPPLSKVDPRPFRYRGPSTTALLRQDSNRR